MTTLLTPELRAECKQDYGIYFKLSHDKEEQEELTHEAAMQELGKFFPTPEKLNLMKGGIYTPYARYWLELV